MNPRAIRFAVLSTLALGVKLTTAHADTFGSGGNAFTINFVDIGNAGNADDAGAGGGLYALPYGGVSYGFRMGVTEVPQDWITKATNLGMTNVTAGAWTGLRPAANMTWYEAAAFVNWLNTSTGHQAAYQLNASNTALTLWSSAQAWQLGGENLYRHKDAYYFLPSEDEWYKAAYHQNDGVTANYWDYATGSNSIPTAVANGTGAGTAVFAQGSTAPAAVDSNGGLSAYGTRGQNGNVFEWTESAFDGLNTSVNEDRVARGGHYNSSGFGPGELTPFYRRRLPPYVPSFDMGFRVASVPEPSCAMLMLSGSLLALARRRSRTRHRDDN
jgi:formylglycine-generating enzyme required for sulfatase activity